MISNPINGQQPKQNIPGGIENLKTYDKLINMTSSTQMIVKVLLLLICFSVNTFAKSTSGINVDIKTKISGVTS